MDWKIIGHEWAVTMLRQHIQKSKLQHAYLFTGAPGIGKRTLALKFAQAINCTASTMPGAPCDSCRDCKQFEAMQHPDLSLITPEDVGGKIKVNQIRELQHVLSLAPYQSKYRIALLQGFDKANANAQNALLKTLEEAPPRVILLLTSVSAENLLPTIVSRCEILRLRPMPLQVLQEELTQSWQIPAEKARLLAHITSGRLGEALQYHNNETLMEQRKTHLEDMNILLKSNIRDRFSYAESASQEKQELHFRFETWLSLWRDMLHLHAQSQAPLINLDWQQDLNSLCHQINIHEINEQASAMEHALAQLETNQNPRLLTEVLLMNWPKI
ncbi:MAG: DNA polymerase III subunit delta' [Anaerolineaceae bacterium]|nr:DNA polymerase III subunit delta' [Anaerolineaceae bacterium]